MGGLGLIIPSEIADSQYQCSKLITFPLSNAIIEQRDFTVEAGSEIKKRREVNCNVVHSHQLKLDELKSMLYEEKVEILKLVGVQGASSWLSSLPIK